MQKKKDIRYYRKDRLQIVLLLYFSRERSAEIHDVDNRLKDCLDALQGRVGGTKTKRSRALTPNVPNDRQIWRVLVEKAKAPKQPGGLGHLTITRLSSP